MPAWSTARTRRERLLGLALRRPPASGAGLLIERCRSVHTFGMRYALDLLWLDGIGTIVRVDRDIPPSRIRSCRAARAVLELPAGSAARYGLAPGARVPSTCPR